MLPILYSFRRCPYAMRARWALLEAGLLVQWREIALKAKPAEMLAVSPKGTVPVLVLPDGTRDRGKPGGDGLGPGSGGPSRAAQRRRCLSADRAERRSRSNIISTASSTPTATPAPTKRSNAPLAWPSFRAGTRGSLIWAGCWASTARWRMPPSGRSCGSGASPIPRDSTTTTAWRPCATGSSVSSRIPASNG